jgi:rfaE bifunctional protein kinase chain/domain
LSQNKYSLPRILMSSKVSQLEDFPEAVIDCLAYGHFDLIHPGHIRYLLNASIKFGGLTVAVMADKPFGSGLPFNHHQLERATALAELSCVKHVLLLLPDNLSQAVAHLKPAVFVVGEEFKQSADTTVIAAIQLQRNAGRRVIFDSGGNETSTTLLSRSEPDVARERVAKYFRVLSENNISIGQLSLLVKSWRGAKVLVVGDSIVDRYVDCEALGLSSEAPVVVVREKHERSFPGGAAIVAAHVSALGGECSLVSVVGEDDAKDLLLSALKEYGVQANLITDKSRPTTSKTRFLVESQKIFRTSRLEEGDIDVDTECALLTELEMRVREVDVIIVSDFNYGVITERVLTVLRRLADEHQCHLIGDLQCSSQYGSVLKFRNFSLITPNEKEARIALSDKSSGLETLAQGLLRKSGSQSLVLKLGSEGFVLYDAHQEGVLVREAFPSLSVAPIDVTGAGDSMLAVFSLAMATNQTLVCASALAACVAAEAVETLGNTPVTSFKLLERLSFYERQTPFAS